MKYSVLLPTRNGGKYLRDAIESIMQQDYDSFELIISDNANTDETAEVIAAYRHDPRVTTVRLDTAVSVTENWNVTYHLSTGDYIMMMGDDDFLLPDYFRKMDAILDRHPGVDCVVHNGFSYVAPGSIKDQDASFWIPEHFAFDASFDREKELDDAAKRSIVLDMFRWKVRIPLNMQTTLVSRRAAQSLAGGLYQPPFPDHYALNALLVSGARWVFSPERLVVVGISPKSFGHFFYSNEQKEGVSYLGFTGNFDGQLPGSMLLDGMHIWLDKLLATYPRELEGVQVDRDGYVRRQIYSWIKQMRLGDLNLKDFGSRMRLLRPRDWAGLSATVVDRESWTHFARLWPMNTKARAQMHLNRLRPMPKARTIAEFAACMPEIDSIR